MGQHLSREEFCRWAEGQRGRYERIAGEPVAMSREHKEHVRLKNRVWSALDRAIQTADLPCEALGDGVTIEIDDDTDYKPDAVVNCGRLAPGKAVAVTNPVVVVEVLSPAT
jgi:Uma2 family endonuclease